MRALSCLVVGTLSLAAGCSGGADAEAVGGSSSSAVEAPVHGASQVRGAGESHVAAMRRVGPAGLPADGGDAGGPTAQGAAVPYASVDFSAAPDWGTEATVNAGFDYIRNPRWIDHRGFERRESWMYPDDGCFARAALAGQRLEADGYARPMKLFLFGNLVAESPNAPQIAGACPPWGQVTWWYHVVPVVRVGTKVRVLDPAVEPYHALDVAEWITRIHPPEGAGGPLADVTLAVCDPYTYDPFGSCAGATSSDESFASSDESYYLHLEWERQTALGRHPRKVLGPSPPWKTGDWLEFDAGGCDAGRP